MKYPKDVNEVIAIYKGVCIPAGVVYLDPDYKEVDYFHCQDLDLQYIPKEDIESWNYLSDDFTIKDYKKIINSYAFIFLNIRLSFSELLKQLRSK